MEDNDSIRVLSPLTTIFRGDDVSNMILDIKLNNRFRTQGTTPNYCLSATLEKINEASNPTQVLDSSSSQVDISFELNAMKDDSSKCFILDGNSNTLHCKLGKNLFESNEKFRIVVSAFPYGAKEIECFGYSQEIT